MYADGCYYTDSQYGSQYFDPNGVWVQNSGWEDDGTRYRKSNGEYAKGWLQVGTKWYYFDSNGYIKTGWVGDKGKWYYCSPHMITNAVRYDGNYAAYYYFDGYGVMKTSKGWVSLKYQNPNGSSSIYYFYVNSTDGKLAYRQWVQDGGKWYYFWPNMVKNQWVSLDDGYSYFFGSDGAWTGEKYSDYSTSSSASGAVVEEPDIPEEMIATESAFAASEDTIWYGID